MEALRIGAWYTDPPQADIVLRDWPKLDEAIKAKMEEQAIRRDVGRGS
jgi:hypothetical protein